MIATPQQTLEAAAAVARQAGYAAHLLGDAIEGEASEVGKVLAGIARQTARRGQPFAPPCVLLSGGETTVTVRGQGRGGRNVECLLSAAIALGGEPRVHALMGDTDGVDGQEEIAGACIGPDLLARAWSQGLRPIEQLADNNGHGFFEALGASVVTGPTSPTSTISAPSRDRGRGQGHMSMRRQRRAKIVATVGPASAGPEVLRELFLAGADVFRLNFSHGSHADHAAARLAVLRELEAETGRPIGILADLQGPKLRVGRFADGPVILQQGQAFRLDLDPAPGDAQRVNLPHPRSSPRSNPAPSCCSTTASCACGWSAAMPPVPTPACWSAGACPSARASTCRACCCRSRR